MNVGIMPLLEILTIDGSDRRVLRNTHVRVLSSISQFTGFPARNFADLVIASRDAIERLPLRQIELVLP